MEDPINKLMRTEKVLDRMIADPEPDPTAKLDEHERKLRNATTPVEERITDPLKKILETEERIKKTGGK